MSRRDLGSDVTLRHRLITSIHPAMGARTTRSAGLVACCLLAGCGSASRAPARVHVQPHPGPVARIRVTSRRWVAIGQANARSVRPGGRLRVCRTEAPFPQAGTLLTAEIGISNASPGGSFTTYSWATAGVHVQPRPGFSQRFVLGQRLVTRSVTVIGEPIPNGTVTVEMRSNGVRVARLSIRLLPGPSCGHISSPS